MPERRRVVLELHDPRVADPTHPDHPAPSLALDSSFDPVEMATHPSTGSGTQVLRGDVDHAEIDALRNHPGVADIWHDFEISFFGATATPPPATSGQDGAPCPLPPCDCNYSQAKGTLEDVAGYIGAKTLWSGGTKGQGVTVGIVGGGITAEGRPISPADTGHNGWPGKLVPRVVDGWPANWGTTGVALDWHGNAMATGVLGIAPEAELYDLRIAGNQGKVTEKGMISDALAAYEWAIRRFRRTGRPQVLNNSWGVYNAAAAPDYTTNPHHCFTRKVVEAIDAGMIVLFAAGNCGATCPAQECGADVGPGHSIWGANGAEKVMTVVAANTLGQYIGYGSQGPAALSPDKPDFCGISHYVGYTHCDFGTSSACAIASGVAALLKCADSDASQAEIKRCLGQSATQIGGDAWNQYSGHGIVRVDAALKALGTSRSSED